MKLSRRQFLAGAAAMSALPASAAAPLDAKLFPKDFLWGASTSAYQIEGALDVDGRGKDIWDTYTEQGRITDGSSAKVACDHYHRYKEDVALMKAAGFNAYRFSLAWPRIVPAGTGAVNPKGLDFYDRLIDELLAAGIKPMACLYHWDLPQPLEDKGGWQGREVTGPFGDYATICAKRFGDRVDTWMMLNEPNVVAIFGYGLTDHAPGHNLGEIGILKALHHQNLAQGTGLRAIRSVLPKATLGTVTNVSPCRPESQKPEDVRAALLWDAAWNRVTLDGLLRGQLPDIVAEQMRPFVHAGDLELAKFPVDLLGLNYYGRNTMKHEPGRPFNAGWGDPKAERYTGMGWPVQPDGLYDILMELKTLYGNPAMYVAENGAAYDDVVSPDGAVHDADRTLFIQEHVAQVARALKDGVNMKGYLAWSLLDNFEWAFGLSKRFGIVRVDYDTLKRTPKDSYKWFASFIKQARGI
ncbi:Beta-glucosidase A [Magnetospirillum sp. LM-5]|nr:Beta-glucosidase A [Magnetospirillum sp. LM-5]